jgi:tRNA pseudouridine38-40 synthase
MNFKLTLQYDGTEFHGWQAQGELRTVQSELTCALTLIEGADVTLHGSGRTDAGVHAEGQVASVVLQREIVPEKLQAAINANVANDVRVIKVEVVPDDFHARYSAIEKTYLYRIVNGRVVSPFWQRYVHLEGRTLDIDLMNQTAKVFLGEHDWTAFSAAQTDATNRVRTVSKIGVVERCEPRAPGRMLEISVSANGFLRYMVRSIAGTLMAAGRGEISAEEVREAIEKRDRSACAATAPASGLTLYSVRY